MARIRWENVKVKERREVQAPSPIPLPDARGGPQAAAGDSERPRIGFELPPPKPPQAEWLFASRGEVCEIVGCGEQRVLLEWTVGLRYIEKLLRRPGEAIPFAEIVADAPPDGATDAAAQTAKEALDMDQWSHQPAMDKESFRKCSERLNDIETELEEARKFHDSGRQDRLEREKEEILAIVQAAKGLGTNTRNLNSDADRLRSRISMALGRAYKKLEDNKRPKLAQHFRESISPEGRSFKYAPTFSAPTWSFDSP